MSKELVQECGLGAILAVAAYIVGFAVFLSAGEPPGPGNMPALLSFLSDHRTNLIIALWVFAIAAILNLGALPAIYQLLREKAGPGFSSPRRLRGGVSVRHRIPDGHLGHSL